ncbi:MAG: NnrS family protein [Sulfurospirillum sp.]
MIFKKENYFLSQPHQPFFILGVVNATIFMFIFMLAYKGVVDLKTTIPFFHAYSLIFLVFTNFFIGFLFTTFPRFNQSETVSKKFYVNLFYTNVIGSILFLCAVIISGIFTFFAMFLLFISYVFMVLKLQNIYNEGYSVNKKDSFWILMAFYFGIVGQILFLAAKQGVDIENLAVNLSFYLYLIFLSFIVAQRMIPFFSHSMEPKDSRFISAVFMLFLLKVICSTFEIYYFVKIFEALLDAVTGLYMLKEFFRWKLLKPGLPAILWVLHLGLFWLPIAFLLSSLGLVVELLFDISFYFLGIHLVALGFLTTVFVGFGTRVVLGHSGQTPHADNFAKNIFLFIQFVLLTRVFFSLNVGFGWGMNFIFDISVSAWLFLFLVWGFRYGRILLFKQNPAH